MSATINPDSESVERTSMSEYEAIYNQDFQPADGDSYGWIQWKGTEVCIDLYCACGEQGHFDGDFLYYYECSHCHAKYAVGQNIKLIKLTEDQSVDKYFKSDSGV